MRKKPSVERLVPTLDQLHRRAVADRDPARVAAAEHRLRALRRHQRDVEVEDGLRRRVPVVPVHRAEVALEDQGRDRRVARGLDVPEQPATGQPIARGLADRDAGGDVERVVEVRLDLGVRGAVHQRPAGVGARGLEAPDLQDLGAAAGLRGLARDLDQVVALLGRLAVEIQARPQRERRCGQQGEEELVEGHRPDGLRSGGAAPNSISEGYRSRVFARLARWLDMSRTLSRMESMSRAPPRT